jgi:hypothetical protein
VAIRCPASASALAESLPDIPIFPGRRQSWLLAVRLPPERDPEPVITRAFQAWLPELGTITEPEIVDELSGPEGLDVLAVAPDELPTPAPVRWIEVAFDVASIPGRPHVEDHVRWPTYTQQRRARVPATCPIAPLTVFPVAVLETQEQAGGIVLQPLDVLPPDDLDLGLGPLPRLPSSRLMLWGAALLGGGFLAAKLWRRSRS